jgi:hypothetical protein
MDEGSVHGSELAGPGCDRGELKYEWDKGNIQQTPGGNREARVLLMPGKHCHAVE